MNNTSKQCHLTLEASRKDPCQADTPRDHLTLAMRTLAIKNGRRHKTKIKLLLTLMTLITLRLLGKVQTL